MIDHDVSLSVQINLFAAERNNEERAGKIMKLAPLPC